MTKKLIVGGLILVACLWVAKRTHFCSYANTIIAKGREQLRQEIPRDLEIARVKNEIQRLDQDYQALLGPIAEKKAAVRRMQDNVDAARVNLSDRRAALLALTNAIEAKERLITFQNGQYSLDQAKVKLARGYADFKKLEVNLATQEKLLDAERQNLAATLEQLGKLVDQKRAFEIEVAQAEADEAVLQVQSIGSPLKTDDSRVADIASSLKEIRERQDAHRERILLQQTYGSKIGDAVPSAPTITDLHAIRNDLEGRASPSSKVAQAPQ
jgi:hypothetical protein